MAIHQRFFRSIVFASAVALAICGASLTSYGATRWDSQALGEINMVPNQPLGSGTQWWFDFANWSPGEPGEAAPHFLPPTNNGTSATDTELSAGTTTLPGGEGIVYDPSANDPNFLAIAGNADFPFPAGFGPQSINQLYVSRNTVNHNLVTIKGDLTIQANAVIGRSGSTGTSAELQNEGRINQLNGLVAIPNNVLDLGNRETSGWGNGIYDYRGGSLEVSLVGGAGLRLSAGGSAGTGGVGRFIMHNPSTPGHVRVQNLNVAAHGGIDGSPAISPDGITNGVGILEFHYENGGTRPFQVVNQLLINNGAVTTGTRSARLDLQLDAAPTVADNKPQNLGLIDVDALLDDFFVGSIGGAGDLGLFFSSADGSTLYSEGSILSAQLGSTIYKWAISYTGNISWSDLDAGAISLIEGPGTGTDVVLIGDSIEVVAGLDGDYNDDGMVDAADYTVWRDNLGGSSSSLNGNGSGAATVVQADYDLWKSQFGMQGSGSGGLAASAVPEPASAVLMLLTVLGFAGVRRRND